MVILYFCRDARGAALPLRSPGFPAPEEGQGCPGECAGVWGQSVSIFVSRGRGRVFGGSWEGGQSSRMRSCVPKGQALLGWGSHKRFVSPVHCPSRERGLRLCLKVVTKVQGVGTEAKQGGVLMHRS